MISHRIIGGRAPNPQKGPKTFYRPIPASNKKLAQKPDLEAVSDKPATIEDTIKSSIQIDKPTSNRLVLTVLPGAEYMRSCADSDDGSDISEIWFPAASTRRVQATANNSPIDESWIADSPSPKICMVLAAPDPSGEDYLLGLLRWAPGRYGQTKPRPPMLLHFLNRAAKHGISAG